MKHENQKIYVHEVTGRTVVDTINNEKSLTQQQFKDECDINNIMAKYINTGEFTSQTRGPGVYADFSQIQDYQQMLDTVLHAQEAFALLPAQVRAKFANDPGKLLAFLQDDKNYEEAVQLGLVTRSAATPQTPANDAIQRDDKPKQKAAQKASKTESSDE